MRRAKAISAEDHQRALVGPSLYEDLTRGEYRCAVCGRPLTPGDGGGMYLDGGDAKPVRGDAAHLVRVAGAPGGQGQFLNAPLDSWVWRTQRHAGGWPSA